MTTQPLPLLPESHPFRSAEEAWFWFAALNRRDEAIRRPCARFDFLRLVERLYRQRRLTPDHLRVMGEYGSRMACPDDRKFHERRAAYFWRDAMDRLEPALTAAGIVIKSAPRALVDLALERAVKVRAS